MDSQAKNKLLSLDPTEQQDWILYEGWTCSIEGRHTIKHLTTALQRHLNGKVILNHWATKEQFSTQVALSINGSTGVWLETAIKHALWVVLGTEGLVLWSLGRGLLGVSFLEGEVLQLGFWLVLVLLLAMFGGSALCGAVDRRIQIQKVLQSVDHPYWMTEQDACLHWMPCAQRLQPRQHQVLMHWRKPSCLAEEGMNIHWIQ